MTSTGCTVSVLVAGNEERVGPNGLFTDWLLWNWKRQTYPFRELVIVTEDHVRRIGPCTTDRQQVRNSPLRDGAFWSYALDEEERPKTVAAKWNRAFDVSRGDVVMVWGDDDWQHPTRLDRSVRALAGATDVVGWHLGWFLDLWTGKLTSPWRSRMFAATMAAKREAWLPFDETIERAADTEWQQRMRKKYYDRCSKVDDVPASLWLVHGRNMTVGRTHHFELPEGAAAELVGSEAWGDTDERLEDLRARFVALSR